MSLGLESHALPLGHSLTIRTAPLSAEAAMDA